MKDIHELAMKRFAEDTTWMEKTGGYAKDMSQILTPKQTVILVLKILDDVVEKHYLPDEREEAKARILNAWSGQMFHMGMQEKERSK